MSITILIVDELASYRQMVRFAIQGPGRRILEAENDDAALALIAAQGIDVLVSGWQPTDPEGVDLIRRVHRSCSSHDLPVIVVSSEFGPELQALQEQLERLLWVKKPFRMAEIQNALDYVLNMPGREIRLSDSKRGDGGGHG
jgi:two-component system chemotaxis response regulator CheY